MKTTVRSIPAAKDDPPMRRPDWQALLIDTAIFAAIFTALLTAAVAATLITTGRLT